MAKTFYSGSIVNGIMTIMMSQDDISLVEPHYLKTGIVIEKVPEPDFPVDIARGKMAVKKLDIVNKKIFYEVVDRDLSPEEKLEQGVEDVQSTAADIAFKQIQFEENANQGLQMSDFVFEYLMTQAQLNMTIDTLNNQLKEANKTIATLFEQNSYLMFAILQQNGGMPS